MHAYAERGLAEVPVRMRRQTGRLHMMTYRLKAGNLSQLFFLDLLAVSMATIGLVYRGPERTKPNNTFCSVSRDRELLAAFLKES